MTLEAERRTDASTLIISIVARVQLQAAEVVIDADGGLQILVPTDRQTVTVQGRACRHGVGETPSCRSEPGYALIVQGFVEG